MKAYNLLEIATEENFSEEAYLEANPDVAKAVREGISLKSGRQHFEIFGKNEGRCIRLPFSVIAEAKEKKLKKIKPLLRKDMPYTERKGHLFDFMTEELRSKSNITDTDLVSSNVYEDYILDIIYKYSDGLILDCGAGQRQVYYENVVNLEVVDYDTTDVLAVAEQLPFKDNSFDAVISYAVLEHVKDPFLCAKELSRVLKKNGQLVCCVAFLQPFHGYPNHYYNMTANGLKNLFDNFLIIDNIDVPEKSSPIWSVSWILRNWANALPEKTREEFLNMKVSELIDEPEKHTDKTFVKELPQDKKFELAYSTVLYAHKK